MLTLGDEFCGFGGSSQGAHAIPGLEVRWAANHAPLALEVHGLNFPDAIHLGGDIARRRAKTFPRVDLLWASPACPPWSNARGKRRDFDKSTVNQGTLWADDETDAQRRERLELAQRRALMEEVVKYLRRMALRGAPVLGGVVENVVEARRWAEWDRWIHEIETAAPAGYEVRVIALNSMHAPARRTRKAPQSRDRLYVAFILRSVGRRPDWDRWLRPPAWCPTCDEQVAAVQTWKRPGVDMGKYRAQYTYRCPRATCRHREVEPLFLPAAAAIDWTLPGERIGDKPLREFFEYEGEGKQRRKVGSLGWHRMSPKTIDRIHAGIRKYAQPITAQITGHTYERRPGVRTWPVAGPLTTLDTSGGKGVAVPPMLVPAGGTWRDAAHPLDAVMPTRTTRDTDGVLVPPMLIPVEGRPGKVAGDLADPFRTQTARNETGIAIPPLVMRNYTARPSAGPDAGGYLSTPVDRPLGALTAAGNQSLLVSPFIAELRGGGSMHRSVTEALATVSAQGNHHGLVTAASTMAAWAALYAYDSGELRDPAAWPLPTQTSVQGDALVAADAELPEVDDCYFRMLSPAEIARGMAFEPDYRVTGTARQQVQGYGNAVTPPAAEVLLSALVECITGEPIEDVA